MEKIFNYKGGVGGLTLDAGEAVGFEESIGFFGFRGISPIEKDFGRKGGHDIII